MDWCEPVPMDPETGSEVVPTSRGPVECVRFGSGPTVVVIHGAPGDCYAAARTYRGLTAQGFSVIAPSRPGYAGTPLGAGKTWPEQADAVVALMDALHISSFAVAGISAGGPVALELALRHANRVWALLLDRAVIQRVQWSADVSGNPGLANDLEQIAAITGWPLEQIAMPTLIVHGTEDVDCPFMQGVMARQKVRDCELRPVEGATHRLWQSARYPEARERQIAFLKLFAPEGS
jgi:pimeloyl-ACP methyl ester carboxylesterase